MIKAIETKYQGYRFRSRLEARWAVFFDKLNIRWKYEEQGFKSNGVCYLPDFTLPGYQMFVEVKPQMPSINEISKVSNLVSEHPWGSLLLVIGSPFCTEEDQYGARFFRRINRNIVIRKDQRFMQCLICHRTLFGTFWDGGCRGRYYCDACDVWDRTTPDQCHNVGCEFHKGDIETNGQNPYLSSSMLAAYESARSERFGT